MTPRRWIASYFLLTGLFLVLYFVGFRSEAVYSLSQNAYTYDHGCWVTGDPEVVILGSSMAFHGIIPEVIARENGLAPGTVVNLGSDGATPVQTYITLQRNAERLKSARLFYLTLDPWVFSEGYYKNSAYERVYWSYGQFVTFAAENQVPNNYFFPGRMFLNNFSRTGCREKAAADFGYLPLHERSTNPEKFRLATQYFQSEGRYGISAVQMDHLTRIAECIAAWGGQLILVTTPKHPDHVAEFATHTEFHRAFETRLAAAVGALPMVGSIHSEDYGIVPEEFVDGTHLLHQGALKFTATEFSDLAHHQNLSASPVRLLQRSVVEAMAEVP